MCRCANSAPSRLTNERFEGRREISSRTDCLRGCSRLCEVAGKRLTTEAEFEFAARGGLTGKPYAWGDELKPGGTLGGEHCQGKFPVKGGDAGEEMDSRSGAGGPVSTSTATDLFDACGQRRGVDQRLVPCRLLSNISRPGWSHA